MKTISALTLATALATFAAPALAQERGDFTVGLGLGWIEPTSDRSSTAAGQIEVEGNLRPTLTFEYFIVDRVGIELLASWPFEHDVDLKGAGDVAETKQLPPTLSVQYHFTNSSRLTPFVGVGVNYTYFFDDEGRGALDGVPVELDESWGIAFHAGLDVAVSDRGALRADVRYIDIDTDAKVGGTDIGDVEIDPWVLNVAYVHRF